MLMQDEKKDAEKKDEEKKEEKKEKKPKISKIVEDISFTGSIVDVIEPSEDKVKASQDK